MPTLYHFTCQHAYRDIGHSGTCVLVPHLHPWLGKKLVWLTDLAEPQRTEVGLTSVHISCDRLQHRYSVIDLDHVRPWLASVERQKLSAEALLAFEVTEDGTSALPDRWWISDQPVRARYDRSWASAAR